jgi:hypothetical protein
MGISQAVAAENKDPVTMKEIRLAVGFLKTSSIGQFKIARIL